MKFGIHLLSGMEGMLIFWGIFLSVFLSMHAFLKIFFEHAKYLKVTSLRGSYWTQVANYAMSFTKSAISLLWLKLKQ